MTSGPRWKRLRWLPELAGAWLWMRTMGALSPEAASNAGGWLGRVLGPRLPFTRMARRNLRLVFPDLARGEEDRIVRAMWDNLGRTAAEYPHLAAITDPGGDRLEIVGRDELAPVLRGESGGIAWSGHFANWEVLAVAASRFAHESVTVVREPNNPLVARFIERYRAVAGGQRVPKGREAGRLMMRALRNKGMAAILLDQRMSDGIPVPFFGHEAMTPPAAAMMAIRLRTPLHPVRIERTGPARFRVGVKPAMEVPEEGGVHERVLALTAACNRVLEDWIRERPEEWMWMHRRWPKETYRELGLDAPRP